MNISSKIPQCNPNNIYQSDPQFMFYPTVQKSIAKMTTITKFTFNFKWFSKIKNTTDHVDIENQFTSLKYKHVKWTFFLNNCLLVFFVKLRKKNYLCIISR